jgi:hypothetical protein
MLQAGVAMGLGLLLFIPTFNALNNSYVEDVAPPPWMPTPDELPDDFTPPEDWTPPDDFKPPEGDYEIPPEWMEKYKGKIPPGGCKPPAIRPIEEIQDKGWTIPRYSPGVLGQPPAAFTRAIKFSLHETTVGYQLWVNLSDWRGGDASVTLTDRNGTKVWSDSEAGPGTPTVIDNPPSKDHPFETFDVADPKGTHRITPGEYTLTIQVEQAAEGAVKLQGQKALACGGMFAR